MPSIRNPILPGFNPDPSILRVGDDYYIATSTFEWYPGVQIHHSRDLANWELVTRPLSRASQLDMRGDPDSCGIWAPCLSHDGEQFFLIYTDVKRKDGSFKDAHNYLVTAPSIEGPWSDPVYMNSSGFDPSLFHDDDGRSWVVSMQWDHRPGHDHFHGILLQEYDRERQCMTGPVRNIFAGSSLGVAPVNPTCLVTLPRSISAGAAMDATTRSSMTTSPARNALERLRSRISRRATSQLCRAPFMPPPPGGRAPTTA